MSVLLLPHHVLLKILELVECNHDRICFVLACRKLFNERDRYLTFLLAELPADQHYRDRTPSDGPPNTYRTHLVFDNRFEQSIRVETIPKSITHLTFDYSFNEYLEPASLPPHLVKLEFGRHFSQRIDPGVLLAPLTDLTFGYAFDSPLPPGTLPETLTRLCFNSELRGEITSSSSLSSTFMRYIGRVIQRGTLPSSVTHLAFGYNYFAPGPFSGARPPPPIQFQYTPEIIAEYLSSVTHVTIIVQHTTPGTVDRQLVRYCEQLLDHHINVQIQLFSCQEKFLRFRLVPTNTLLCVGPLSITLSHFMNLESLIKQFLNQDWNIPSNIFNSDDYVPPPVPGRWDDEKTTIEEEVADDWDADEEEKVEEPTVVQKPAPKPLSKAQALKKALELRKKEEEMMSNDPMDPYLEKKKRQDAQEAADLEHSKNLFSGFVISEKKDPALDAEPKTEKEFETYALSLSAHLTRFEKSFHYPGLLKNLLKTATSNMGSAELNDVIKSLTVIVNEKIKAEKASGGKKKTTKASVKKSIVLDNEMQNFDDFDDDSFM
eukprot:gene173-206_t